MFSVRAHLIILFTLVLEILVIIYFDIISFNTKLLLFIYKDTSENIRNWLIHMFPRRAKQQ